LNWLDAIQGASDASELQKVGQDIAGLDLTDRERQVLQSAWKNKRAKFA
jgi:predicted DNA binding protein